MAVLKVSGAQMCKEIVTSCKCYKECSANKIKQKIGTACVSIGCLSLLKVSWDEVRKEMVEDKGVVEDVADRIGHYVKLHGSKELLDQLTSDPDLTAVKDARVGLDEMGLLLRYCELYGILDKASLEQHNLHNRLLWGLNFF